MAAITAVALMERSHVEQPFALRAGVTQEGIGLTPDTELQALLAENSVERLLDDAALLLHEGIAELRGQPLPDRLRIV